MFRKGLLGAPYNTSDRSARHRWAPHVIILHVRKVPPGTLSNCVQLCTFRQLRPSLDLNFHHLFPVVLLATMCTKLPTAVAPHPPPSVTYILLLVHLPVVSSNTDPPNKPPKSLSDNTSLLSPV